MPVIFFSNHGQYKQEYQTQGRFISLTKWRNLEHELQRELENHKLRQTLYPSLMTVLMLSSLLFLSLSWRFFPSNFPTKILCTWYFSTDTYPSPILPIVQRLSDAVHKWLYSMCNSCHLTVYCLAFSTIRSPYYLFHYNWFLFFTLAYRISFTDIKKQVNIKTCTSKFPAFDIVMIILDTNHITSTMWYLMDTGNAMFIG